MNFGIARRHWKWLLLLSVCSASGIAAFGPTDDRAPVASVRAVPETAASFNSPTTLPAREMLGRARIDPFAPRSWTPPPSAPVQTTEAPAEPVLPPVPYRFAGMIQHNGVLRVVLAAGERAYLVKAGEVLDDLYRVHAVSRSAVTLVYLPLGIEQQLAYVADTALASAAAPGPFARSLADQRP
jgi:hypothetical protein